MKTLYTALLLLCLTNTSLFSNFLGSGTETDPYQIWNRADMEALADSVNTWVNYSKGKHFKVMTDITDSVRKMIGKELHSSIGENNLDTMILKIGIFQGHFDGNNKKITLSLDGANFGGHFHDVGLFCNAYEALIENLTVDGFIRARNQWGNAGAGGIIHIGYRTDIINCHNNKVTFDADGCRGIGSISGIIRDCSNYADFNGSGIGMGGGNSFSVINCHNYGNLVGNGIAYSAKYILNCNNYGNLTKSGAGIAHSARKVENCNNYGNITSDTSIHTAGIINSSSYKDTVINCNNYGNITIKSPYFTLSRAAGISADEAAIINCHNYGNITADGTVGGIAMNPSIVRNSTNWGNIINNHNLVATTFGIAVGAYFSDRSNCINLGNIISYISNPSDYYGVSRTGGILASYFLEPAPPNTVFDSNFIYIDTVKNCVNVGFVTGYYNVGGIVGGGFVTRGSSSYRNTYSLNNCINAGVVAPFPCTDDFKHIGAIVGDGLNMIAGVSNCFYDKQLCEYGGIDGRDYAGKAEGLLTEELVGTGLLAKLGTADWVYNPNLYPLLKQYENDRFCKIATSPAYFNAQTRDYDTHKKLRKDFTMNTENNVKWSNAFDNVVVVGNQGIVRKAGRDTLYAGMLDTIKLFADSVKILNLHKTVPITVVDTFSLTLYPQPAEGGTTAIITGTYVDSVGRYFNDTSFITIEAKASKCHRFVNWTDSATGEVVSWSAVYRFCFPPNNLTLFANFAKDTFELVLKTNPENAGIVTGAGRFPCEADTFAVIEAQELGCYKFKNWTNEATNEIVSDKLIDTIKMDKNYVLVANFEKPVMLTVSPNPLYYGDILFNTTHNRKIELSNKISNMIEITDFRFSLGNVFELSPALTTIYLNGLSDTTLNISVFSTKAGYFYDTLKFTVKYPDCDDTIRIPIHATFNEVGVTIRASEHKEVDPRTRNYSIPFYLQATNPYILQGVYISELEFMIDWKLFYPRSVNNGDLTFTVTDSLYIFKVMDIAVPHIEDGLPFDTEIELFCLVGDVLLGNKDSVKIALNSASLPFPAELVDGYLTIEICRAGGDRLVDYIDFDPSVLVRNNPVTGRILEVECKTIELGDYRLEVIDLLGHTTIINKWSVPSKTSERIFNFEIPIENYSNGNYLLVMHTPTSRYITKFVISQ